MAASERGRRDPQTCRIAPALRLRYAPMLPIVKEPREALVNAISRESDGTLVCVRQDKRGMSFLKPHNAGCSITVRFNKVILLFLALHP